MRRWLWFALLGAAVLPIVAAAGEVPAAEVLQPARIKLKALVDSGRVPGAAVIVSRGENILWSEGLGWADREARRSADINTSFPVASTSKAITGTALQLLVARGRVALDDPIRKYLPGLPRGHKHLQGKATVGQLLAMTAGVPHGWFYQYGEGQTQPAPAELVRRYAVAAFEPGGSFLYSNFSYALAARVIEAASGESFHVFVERELLQPLGMKNSFLGYGAWRRDSAAPYNHEGRRMPEFKFHPDGGAGFYSSASDLWRFARFHLGRGPAPAIPPDQLQAIRQSTASVATYSDGWGVIALGEHGRAHLSNGQILGGSATVLILPTQEIAIVVAGNSNESYADAIAFEVAEALVPGFQAALQKAQAAHEAGERAAPQPLHSLAGTWKGELSTGGDQVPATLTVAEEQVTLRLDGKDPIQVEDVTLTASKLRGRASTKFPLDDGLVEWLELELEHAGDRLCGAARARGEGRQLPGFGLPLLLCFQRIAEPSARKPR